MNDYPRRKGDKPVSAATWLCIALLLGVPAQAATTLSEEAWGTLADGTAITRYTLTNSSGARASFMAQGAAILALEAPDSEGALADVVLGRRSAGISRPTMRRCGRTGATTRISCCGARTFPAS